eukprot:CAMPEP_0114152910 /NCGR_PEP_ID=MMETSP0043_2-20121206/24067_1 /TAXON_ID=464988 /ORGANISM="Hemiselmis andersenii, Strain CCMP644" /LENGTH=152 /DNA_ID=CAMNT_0001247897 /DNA_START=70 /DNA_END=525 /DNA_ORIENTATION=-
MSEARSQARPHPDGPSPAPTSPSPTCPSLVEPMMTPPTTLSGPSLSPCLLSVLIGIDAKYIRIKCTSDRLNIQATSDVTLDLSLADLVTRVLPLATSYVRVVRFIEMREHYEYGMVNHAFCSAMQELVREYLILIAQLETQFNAGKLTLQKL